MHYWAVQIPFQAAVVGIQLFNNAMLATSSQETQTEENKMKQPSEAKTSDDWHP